MNQSPQTVPPYPVKRGDELDLIGLWKILVEYKFLITIFTIITTLGAYYYTLNLPTIYKAQVLMFPSIAPDNTSNRFSGIGISLGGSSVGLQGDRSLARLNTISFLTNYIQEKNIKPILFAGQWNELEQKWINNEPSDLESSELLLSMMDIYINPKDGTGLVTLLLEWENPTNPDKIADIANSLVDNMNFTAKQRAIVEAKKSISFLEKELEKTSIINSQEILYGMIERQMQDVMLANTRDEFVFKIIDPAIVPKRAENKPVLMVIFTGLILGIFFGSFVAFFIYLVKKKD
jgi:capsular polysaccharide biosynthesis protein